MLLRPPNALLFAFERGAAAIAINVDFKDRGVVNKPVNGGKRHGGVADHRMMP